MGPPVCGGITRVGDVGVWRCNIPPNSVSPSVASRIPTFTVSGTIVEQGGAPVEGVKVEVAGRQGHHRYQRPVPLLNVPQSYGGALAVKAGYAAARETLSVNSDTRFDVQLGPRVARYTLSGVVSEVTPTGLTPLEGAHVHQVSCEDILPAPPFFPGKGCPVLIFQTVTTDKQGRYSFSGLGLGQGELDRREQGRLRGSVRDLRRTGGTRPKRPRGDDRRRHAARRATRPALTVPAPRRLTSR